MKTEILDAMNLIRRGTENMIDDGGLEAKLLRSAEEGKPLIVKLGVDPTAPDIHLGHTVPFRKLRHFQDLGHDVCFLIGDFTGRIGDPSGRDKTRPPLTEEDILRNAQTYIEQIGKIVDTTKLRVVFNSSWLKDLTFGQLVEMAAQVTVSKIFEHNTFRERFENSGSIRMHELLYPFMQGFDSVALKADVELGGSDQTFNLTFGRDLQKFFGQEPQVCITMPILPGTDGVQKMSKSLGNYIGINEPAPIMLEKVMRMNDANIIPWFTLLTDISVDEITEWKSQLAQNPSTEFIRSLKSRLAFEIIAQFHDKDEAEHALDGFGSDDKKNLPEISLSTVVASDVPELMVNLMGIKSKAEARRLVGQGAVSVNGKKTLALPNLADFQPGDLLKVGKFKMFRFVA